MLQACTYFIIQKALEHFHIDPAILYKFYISFLPIPGVHSKEFPIYAASDRI